MLHDSKMNVIVGVRLNGPSAKLAKKDGLRVASIADAAKQADIIHILIPDEVQREVYEKEIAKFVTADKTLSFSHGFSIVFKRIKPPRGVNIIMVAPKCPGTEERKCYLEGFGVPALISFEDLFGEQTVLCGGMAELIKAGFETLVEAGYPPELAYFECLHETKLIMDLIYEGGIARMYEVVSNTAEWGGRTVGPKIIDKSVKQRMKTALKDIESGKFARGWMKEYASGMKQMKKLRAEEKKHPIEKVGAKIRKLFEK